VIRLVRPARAPRLLQTEGAAETTRLCAAYNQDRAAYRAGTKRFEFHAELYGHTTVKRALLKFQHDKCAFCEAKITHIAFGDVEHYRPKGGFRQRRSGVLKVPGYYWLAYDWRNLLVSCAVCNQRFKGNRFPLALHSPRARSPRHDLQRERPLFLNPAEDDPAQHLGFRDHVVYAVEDSPRGKATRQGLGLNRPKLKEDRERYLDLIRAHLVLARMTTYSGHSESRLLLRRAVRPDAPYSAMVRAWLTAEGYDPDATD
jgi:uncharacterized protein (TIGR02646 family)